MERKVLKLSYDQLKKWIDKSIKKEEARQRILSAKRAEKRAIKKAGGGHNIARSILPVPRSRDTDGTDFNFGENLREQSTDERIEADYNSRCMEMVRCPKCGTNHGYCAEIKEDKERLKMLPTGNESSGRRSRNDNPNAVKWIKVENLTTQPKEAKILKVFYNENGRFGARVELKLAFEGDIVYFGVDPAKNSKNPNYKELTAKFGHDENNWIDQRILLFVEPHPFYENQYNIRVDFPKKGARS